MKVKWLSKEKLIKTISKKIDTTAIILDIGCGIAPQRYIKPVVHICADPFGQYIDHLKKEKSKNFDRYYIFLKSSWAEVIETFPPKSVDTIFLLDVIEHLDKKESLKLLKKTDKIARKQICIFTTLGYVPQSHPDKKDAWGLNGGEWQRHKSGWKPEDFNDGWKVYACKEYHFVDNLNQPFKKPEGALWAIKNIEKPASQRNQQAEMITNLNSQLTALNSVFFIKNNIRVINFIISVIKLFGLKK